MVMAARFGSFEEVSLTHCTRTAAVAAHPIVSICFTLPPGHKQLRSNQSLSCFGTGVSGKETWRNKNFEGFGSVHNDSMSRQQQKWTLLYNLLESMAGKVLTGEHPDPCLLCQHLQACQQRRYCM